MLPAYLVLAAGLVALSVIDFEHFLLPNRIVYPLAVGTLALLALAAVGDDAWAAFGRAVLGGVAAIGDARRAASRLAAQHGLRRREARVRARARPRLARLERARARAVLGFLSGAVVGIALIALRHRGRKDHLPFGPFLAAGTLTVLLWGDVILRWYRG